MIRGPEERPRGPEAQGVIGPGRPGNLGREPRREIRDGFGDGPRGRGRARRRLRGKDTRRFHRHVLQDESDRWPRGWRGGRRAARDRRRIQGDAGNGQGGPRTRTGEIASSVASPGFGGRIRWHQEQGPWDTGIEARASPSTWARSSGVSRLRLTNQSSCSGRISRRSGPLPPRLAGPRRSGGRGDPHGHPRNVRAVYAFPGTGPVRLEPRRDRADGGPGPGGVARIVVGLRGWPELEHHVGSTEGVLRPGRKPDEDGESEHAAQAGEQ